MSLIEVREFAEAQMTKYKLIEAGWKFEFFTRRKRTLGLCDYRNKTISLNAVFVKGEGFNANVKDVVLHEIAHALTPGAKHGPVWKRMAVRIGAEPKATGATKVELAEHTWELRFKGEVFNKWFKRPTKFEKSVLRGVLFDPKRKKETLGNMTLWRRGADGTFRKWASADPMHKSASRWLNGFGDAEDVQRLAA